MAQYARPIREEMRSTVGPFADRLWREKEAVTSGPFETDGAAERVDLEIQKLSPHDAVQRSLQARAVQISNDLAQVRFLLFAESENLIPSPFLAVLAFWLLIIFASFSLFSPLNETVFACLSLFALSSAGAIFLILKMSRPFTCGYPACHYETPSERYEIHGAKHDKQTRCTAAFRQGGDAANCTG
jgi:hypothetical protein